MVLISDIACPWATVVVLRLRPARASLGVTTGWIGPAIPRGAPTVLADEAGAARRLVAQVAGACS